MDDGQSVKTPVVPGQIEYDQRNVVIESHGPALEQIVGTNDVEAGTLDAVPKPLDVGRGASDHQYVLSHRGREIRRQFGSSRGAVARRPPPPVAAATKSRLTRPQLGPLVQQQREIMDEVLGHQLAGGKADA